MPAMQVRMGTEEYALVKERARESGVSVSEWVRRRLLGEVPAQIPKVDVRPQADIDFARRDEVCPVCESAIGSYRHQNECPPGKKFEELTLSERLGAAEEMVEGGDRDV